MSFHTDRQMFVVVDGNLIIAQVGNPHSHSEWFATLSPYNDWIYYCTRGYILNGKLVAYLGEDFSHRVNHKDVCIALNHFKDIHTVGFGAIYEPNKEQWPCHTEFRITAYLAAIKQLEDK